MSRPMAKHIPNRTKIVATLGPASSDAATVRELVRAGADVFRVNCAHSDHPTLGRMVRTVRKVAKEEGAAVGILADLQGPKIRVGPLRDAEPFWLSAGDGLIISCQAGVVGEAAAAGETAVVGSRYPGLYKDVKPGERILIDDGNIELEVHEVRGKDVHTTVIYGGLLKQYKGINLPGSKVSLSSLSTKDTKDLKVVLELKVDYVALSFVRAAKDVVGLKRRIRRQGGTAKVIAKVERPEAVDQLDEILEVSDGLMVARGDMGVELGAEFVPAIQKRIIRKCVEAKKPVITATQMLESMILNPRPTRAEASDVANAIYDGTSAVMLSAETATGKHPVQTVRIMERILRRTEEELYSSWDTVNRRRRGQVGQIDVSDATVRAAAFASYEVGATVISVLTESGATAQALAGERPPTRIYAFTPFAETVQQLALVWGVTAVKLTRFRTRQEMSREAERYLLEEQLAKPGQRIVLVCGTMRKSGLTNLMTIRTL